MAIRLPQQLALELTKCAREAIAKPPRRKRPRDLFGHLVPDPKERDVKQAVQQYLILKGVFHWRANSAKVHAVRPDGSTFWLECNFPGCPDLLAVLKPRGTLWGIETKTLTGRKREAQERVAAMFLTLGGMWTWARSIDDVQRDWEAYNANA